MSEPFIADKNQETLSRGEVYFAEGNIDKAQRVFLSILAEDPSHKEALNNLGVMACAKNHESEAIAYFTQALGIDPYYRDAIFNLIHILQNINALDKAIPHLKQAADRYPDDETIKEALRKAESKSQWKFYCSPGMLHHGEPVRKMLGLPPYVPSIHIEKPVWFFGIYFESDYLQILAHHGNKIINWRGTDATQLQREPRKIQIIKSTRALHICQSSRQQKILSDLGIPSIVHPMVNTKIEDIEVSEFPKDSTHVLIYWRKGMDEFIGADMFFEIASKCKDVTFHIVGDEDPSRFNQPGLDNLVYHGFVSEDRLDQIMDRCKGTIRPWQSDGTPNIQTRMLLKGRYAAHRIKFEKVTQCSTIEAYVSWIHHLKNITRPNLEARDWWLAHLNNFDFLETDFQSEDLDTRQTHK